MALQKYLSGIIMLFTLNALNAQQYQWAKQIADPYNNGDLVYGLEIDHNGFIYLLGPGSLTTDMDPGPGIALCAGLNYLSKYDPDGNLLWTFSLISDPFPFGIVPECMDLDPLGNILVSGEIYGSIDLDPDTSVFMLTADVPSSYIAKYNKDGHFIWGKLITESESRISQIVCKHNKIFVSGFFRDTANFDVGSGTYTFISKGSNDCFFAEFNNGGGLMRAKSFGSESEDEASSITVAPNGDIIVAGITINVVDFDPGPGTYLLSPAVIEDHYNGFMARYDSTGSILNAYIFASVTGSTCIDVMADQASNILIEGGGSNFDMDPGPAISMTPPGSNVFIAKYNSSGQLLWNDHFGSGSSTIGIGHAAQDATGNFFITGDLQGEIDFDPGPGTALHDTIGKTDIFLAKYTSEGELVWASTTGGKGSDLGAVIQVDNYGGIYIAGHFQDTCDFDFGTATAELDNVNLDPFAFNSDLFFAKYTDESSMGITEKTLPLELIQLYPNPGNGSFTMISNEDNITRITIKTINGQIVFNHPYSQNRIDLNLDVSNGLYLVEIVTSHGYTTKKLVVER